MKCRFLNCENDGDPNHPAPYDNVCTTCLFEYRSYNQEIKYLKNREFK